MRFGVLACVLFSFSANALTLFRPSNRAPQAAPSVGVALAVKSARGTMVPIAAPVAQPRPIAPPRPLPVAPPPRAVSNPTETPARTGDDTIRSLIPNGTPSAVPPSGAMPVTQPTESVTPTPTPSPTWDKRIKLGTFPNGSCGDAIVYRLPDESAFIFVERENQEDGQKKILRTVEHKVNPPPFKSIPSKAHTVKIFRLVDPWIRTCVKPRPYYYVVHRFGVEPDSGAVIDFWFLSEGSSGELIQMSGAGE